MHNLTTDLQIESTWKHVLDDEFRKPYYSELTSFLVEEKKQYIIYPTDTNIFNAFNTTPLDKVEVVIIGQDPYHGPGQAHGLAFSVQEGVKTPPSLLNIFKEYSDDLGFLSPTSGDLTKWAQEGVFLINTVLTVRKGEANSHKGRGWESFIDAVIQTISEKREHVVFILWGRPAQMKEKLIDESRHLILRAPHPSPLSSYRGFFGSRPFTKANAYLTTNGIRPIDWQL